MKILYLITGLGGGGAEKVVADLADQMTLRGHTVKIAYLKGELVVSPKNKSIELICLGLESLKDAKKAYQNYQEIIMQFAPDVVHSHMVHANIFARISRIFCQVKRLICTAHSNNEGGYLRMLVYRITHTLADVTTNVSDSACQTFESLKAVPEGGIGTVYNGIDLEKFKLDTTAGFKIKKELGIVENQKIFLAVGRFHESKDYPNLIQAFAKLLQVNHIEPIPKLVIAGDGELKEYIKEMIIKLSLQDHIILLGRRNDIPALMSAADYFVLSSLFEGFGLVIAEAMACQCYVIATDSGGVKEVMGGFGQLVPSKNSDILAEKMKYVFNMQNMERLENNENALKYVRENFDLQRIIDQWLNIYASE